MHTRNASDWQQVHYQDATILDLHAHPSLKVSLFNRLLTSRFRAGRSFDPFGVRTDFPKLKEGGLDILMSSIYVPEKGILEECRYLRLLRYVMRSAWHRVFSRPYFDVAMDMIDAMEGQVERAQDAETGKPLASMIRSVQELDELLGQPGERPVGVIHCVEGSHCLDGNLDNVARFFDRGVAYMTLAHFY
jgi:microsomal dipeptidase-like Zn-dependent dipeptidase